jgi:hypothetical protein
MRVTHMYRQKHVRPSPDLDDVSHVYAASSNTRLNRRTSYFATAAMSNHNLNLRS